MEGGFPYGDIIVIAAIAAFILLRYRAMLGEKSGREIDLPRARMEPLEPVIQLEPREPARAAEAAAKALRNEPAQFAEQFTAMRAIDPEFSAEAFLTGARGAYEMVIEAYNEGDHDTLKMLLAGPIYQEFSDALTANEKAGRRAHTTLLAIVKAEIAQARLKGNKASITVDFLSEQIPLVRNGEGEIIEGNPSHQEAVEDQWVFERNLAGSDPAWKVVDS